MCKFRTNFQQKNWEKQSCRPINTLLLDCGSWAEYRLPCARSDDSKTALRMLLMFNSNRALTANRDLVATVVRSPINPCRQNKKIVKKKLENWYEVKIKRDTTSKLDTYEQWGILISGVIKYSDLNTPRVKGLGWNYRRYIINNYLITKIAECLHGIQI